MTETAFRWSGAALVCTVWISATLFGLYIVAFYVGALADGQVTKWNQNLPGLYEPHSPAATPALGLHFLAGGVILILGCIQLIGRVRTRWPALHRWLGRIYVSAALLAGLGGLTFIFVVGTIGGRIMDVGFWLYGALMRARAQPTSGMGPASVCACDRIVAVSHGLWILAAAWRRPRAQPRFSWALRSGDGILFLPAESAHRRGLHSRQVRRVARGYGDIATRYWWRTRHTGSGRRSGLVLSRGVGRSL